MHNPVPVSPPPWMPPPQAAIGNTGPVYGTQSRHVWVAGQTDERGVIDVVKAVALWRISVFGSVLVRVTYGTQATREFAELQAPVVMTVPGQVVVSVRPRDDEGAICTVTLTQATDGGPSHARKFADAGGVGVDLDNDAVRFVALTASTLTISGAAVVVPALSSVPLVAGSSLDTGSGFQEFEA